MNLIKNSIKLINILVNKKIYSANYLAKILEINLKELLKCMHILSLWGIDFNINNNKYYQINKNIELLNYQKLCEITKTSNIFLIPIIHSTNQYMLESLETLNIGDVCIAEHQTNGRGKCGSYWASPFGCNLYLSIYWYFSEILKKDLELLSLVISIIIAETLNKLTDNNIKIKWPNDLYLHGKKLAGILIEIKSNFKDKMHIIIGIGINIDMSDKQALKIHQKWINLEPCNNNIGRNEIAGKIILALRNELPIFSKYGFYPFMQRLLKLNQLLYNNIINKNKPQ
uniref:Bifunctional biotin--[acetyl-CoA-carboxylase] ligase/biotin operon repressor BirA n=1 Tax=Candidatus Aschnera chinzeii TaxID=1485666 RepID=A0AAT9G598_9ENTR|nr:MAG: bifunctional biotin--[acetyl-CoA-carboxylase] ligase/biotin operon repressor BirA [Candidatus Aschnera chinzeii]